MRLSLALLAVTAIHAGVIRGVVVERASGLPLARTVVRLIPLPNAHGQPLAQRTATSGGFTFDHVPDGVYVLVAAREGFFQAAYGQRRPDGQGTPIEVTADSDLFANLPMYHKGAVTGRVLDENGVGMENIPVIVYRARLPLRAEGRAVSDDRGIYRIHGLAPGKYWVRSAPQTLDDGSGRLPTFGREAPETKDALTHRVRLDEDTPFADVRPAPGRLFPIRGLVQCFGYSVTVTLSSETMQRSSQVPCGAQYQFEGLSPGVYQVLAKGDTTAGFIEISVDHAIDSANVQPLDLPRVEFYATRPGSGAPANITMTIFGRREDLSAEGKLEEIKPRGSTLLPGHWEIIATVGPDQYVESIGNDFTARRGLLQQRPPDAFDVFIETRQIGRVRVVISDKAGHIDGSVVRDTKPVPGAAVFLWPTTEAARRSLGGFKQAIADINGKFHFDGLPPADYRILATFDLSDVDEESFDEARAMTITVQASQTASVETPLWIAP